MTFVNMKLINDPKGSHYLLFLISLASFFALCSPIVLFFVSHFVYFTIFRRVLWYSRAILECLLICLFRKKLGERREKCDCDVLGCFSFLLVLGDQFGSTFVLGKSLADCIVLVDEEEHNPIIMKLRKNYASLQEKFTKEEAD